VFVCACVHVYVCVAGVCVYVCVRLCMCVCGRCVFVCVCACVYVFACVCTCRGQRSEVNVVCLTNLSPVYL